MGRLSAKLRSQEGGHVAYWCQGCDSCHSIRVNATDRPSWTWDGNVDAPTFSPSVLVTSGHYVPNWKQGDSCWCNAPDPDDRWPECTRCHTFIRNGMVEFLSDCAHALAGQTLPLPDWPYAEGEYGGV